MTKRSLLRWSSTAMLLPCTVLEKPHWGDSAGEVVKRYFPQWAKKS